MKNPLYRQAATLQIGMSQRSSRRGIKHDPMFSLSYIRDWLKSQKRCDCCGVKFDIKPKHDRRAHANSPSLDRINTKKGYVKGNVALICWRCNKLKADATSKELHRIADWMDMI